MKSINKIIFLIVFLISQSVYAKTVFIYNNSIKGSNNVKVIYDYKVLKLSLDKTVKKYGEYDLIPAPNMNKKRAISTVKSNKIKNFIVKISVTKELLSELSYTNFPVDLGVTGYRVSFVSPKIKDKIYDYNTLDKLRTLKIGQGIGWLDVNILEYNGFKVETVSNYTGLIYMLTRNRFDLFPRGANELLGEYETYKHIKYVDYDKTFVLYYPLPRFFFTHKSNQKAIQRIEEGLKIAYEDGSLKEIFNEYFKKSMDFANLKNRKFYNLENPYLEGIDTSYEKYIYNPF